MIIVIVVLIALVWAGSWLLATIIAAWLAFRNPDKHKKKGV